MSDQNDAKDIPEAPEADAEEAAAKGGAGKDPEAKKKSVPGARPENVADLQGKVEIVCDKPLPVYDLGSNKAYRAYSKDQNRTPLIAIVCERHLVPRRHAAEVYKVFVNPSIAKLVLHGAAYWPPAKRERYVLVYYDNLGKPILDPGAKSALGWKQDDVMSVIVRPMVNVLQDFRDKDFVHGGIRPSNMFDGGAAGKPSKIILGDCLSSSASYMQPVLYETVPRAMADPIARGKGTPSDDLYALGVSLAVIMRLHDPMFGMSEVDIIKQKMVLGSYAAVTGKDRFKGEILELLRGLLHDDPSQRWTIDEVLVWLDGRRLTPKQAVTAKKAPRPFHLGEDKYFLAPLMAMDLDFHVKETKRAIEDETLMNWVERSLEDEETAMRLEKSVEDARQQASGSSYENCLVSNVSIALDPNAPLRFKGLRMIGDGIGAAMVEALVLGQPIGAFAEVFINALVLNWLNVQSSASVDVTGLYGKFERCRRYLKTSKFGEGLERTIYTLCPEAPCLSEIVKEYFVTGPDDLLRAFEDLCKRGKVPGSFLDHHSVAFLYEKDQKVIEPYLFDLNTHENHRVIGANLKCMAAIQKRYDMPDMPFIAKSLAPRLQAMVKRYHDRHVQEKMRESVAEFQVSGDISKIASIFDNNEVIKKDFSSFKKAMHEYKVIEEERQKLEMKLQDADKFGVETGREVSAIVSSVVAFLLILGSGIMFFTDKSPF